MALQRGAGELGFPSGTPKVSIELFCCKRNRGSAARAEMPLHSLQPCPPENPGMIWWVLQDICQVLPGSAAGPPVRARRGRDPQPSRVRGSGFSVAPLEPQMAGEKWELPPQLGPVPTHSPPRSPPRQRLSGTRSSGISAGSSKSTERPAFSPKIWPPACPQLGNASPCQPPRRAH